MTDDSRTCPSCGARVPPEADRCDLCGTPVEEPVEASGEPDEDATAPGGSVPAEEELTPDPEESTDEAPTVFCNQCGWENPPGARYCSRCGERLQDLSGAAPADTPDPAPADTSDTAPPGTRPVSADLPKSPSSAAPTDTESTDTPEERDTEEQEADEQVAMGRQIMLVVGSALAVVLGLFFVTQWSSQYEWGGDASPDGPPARAEAGGSGASSGQTSGGQQPRSAPDQEEGRTAPTDLQTLLDQAGDTLSSSIAGQVDSLRTRIERASGEEGRRLQAELVNLLIGAGHPGRAAVVQKTIAETTGAADARRRAADLLYRWMQKLQQQRQRKQLTQVARHAAEAYAAVAEERPNDLDARTRMGEAYLLTNSPMQGIKAINAVLDEDSTFVPARLQKGIALLQINRLDQAERQFRMVQRYAEDGSPFYQHAERALKVIRKREGGASSEGARPSGAES